MPLPPRMDKVECEARLQVDHPKLWQLIEMSWWYDESPLRRWLTHARDYAPAAAALDILTEQLSTVERTFPRDFRTWRNSLQAEHLFWSKIFEARAIDTLAMNGMALSHLEPMLQDGHRPDLELNVNGSQAMVECTSLSTLGDVATSDADEDLQIALLRIPRSYCFTLNLAIDGREGRVDRLYDFIVSWLDQHDDGDEDEWDDIPGLMNSPYEGCPIASMRYRPGTSPGVLFLRSQPLAVGNLGTLGNRLVAKCKQLKGAPTDTNVVAVDVSFRYDLSLAGFMQGAVTAIIENLFGQAKTKHVAGIHVSTMDIMRRTPFSTASYLNPGASTASQAIAKVILNALGSQDSSLNF